MIELFDIVELLTELARREKEAGIVPEAEVDLFMKATAMEGVEGSLITDYTLRVNWKYPQLAMNDSAREVLLVGEAYMDTF